MWNSKCVCSHISAALDYTLCRSWPSLCWSPPPFFMSLGEQFHLGQLLRLSSSYCCKKHKGIYCKQNVHPTIIGFHRPFAIQSLDHKKLISVSWFAINRNCHGDGCPVTVVSAGKGGGGKQKNQDYRTVRTTWEIQETGKRRLKRKILKSCTLKLPQVSSWQRAPKLVSSFFLDVAWCWWLPTAGCCFLCL